MKEIKAVVQPQRLELLRQAFRRVQGFPGMTASRGQGTGFRVNSPEPRGIKAELIDYADKVRIEIVAPDDMVVTIVGLIHNVCHTGRRGDGVVWVSAVETFQRIREPLGANGVIGRP